MRILFMIRKNIELLIQIPYLEKIEEIIIATASDDSQSTLFTNVFFLHRSWPENV